MDLLVKEREGALCVQVKVSTVASTKPSRSSTRTSTSLPLENFSYWRVDAIRPCLGLRSLCQCAFAAFQQLASRPTNSSSSTDGGANTGNGGNTTTGDNGGNGGNGNGAGMITPTVGISAFTFVLAGLTAMLL